MMCNIERSIKGNSKHRGYFLPFILEFIVLDIELDCICYKYLYVSLVSENHIKANTCAYIFAFVYANFLCNHSAFYKWIIYDFNKTTISF